MDDTEQAGTPAAHPNSRFTVPALPPRLISPTELPTLAPNLTVRFEVAAQPNVEVVSEKIIEVRPHGVVTADGIEHAVDTIILGTGFRVTDNPMMERVRGAAGVSLAEQWADGRDFSKAKTGLLLPIGIGLLLGGALLLGVGLHLGIRAGLAALLLLVAGWLALCRDRIPWPNVAAVGVRNNGRWHSS